MSLRTFGTVLACLALVAWFWSARRAVHRRQRADLRRTGSPRRGLRLLDRRRIQAEPRTPAPPETALVLPAAFHGRSVLSEVHRRDDQAQPLEGRQFVAVRVGRAAACTARPGPAREPGARLGPRPARRVGVLSRVAIAPRGRRRVRVRRGRANVARPLVHPLHRSRRDAVRLPDVLPALGVRRDAVAGPDDRRRDQSRAPARLKVLRGRDGGGARRGRRDLRLEGWPTRDAGEERSARVRLRARTRAYGSR